MKALILLSILAISSVFCDDIFTAIHIERGIEATLLKDGDTTYESEISECTDKNKKLINNFIASGRVVTRVVKLWEPNRDEKLAEMDLPKEVRDIINEAMHIDFGYKQWSNEDYIDGKLTRTKEIYAVLAYRINQYITFRYAYSSIIAYLKDDYTSSDVIAKIDSSLDAKTIQVVKSHIDKQQEK